MKHVSIFAVSLALLLPAGCGGADESASRGAGAHGSSLAKTPAPAGEEEGHEHAEEPLGTVEIGGLAVEFAQGHGGVVAGKEGHLVVKLPYSDSGATIVRAWIGTRDRTLSYVGKGEYAPSHDDYDVHATAPDPLPADPMWWVEIEKPDGTKLVGSVEPLME